MKFLRGETDNKQERKEIATESEPQLKEVEAYEVLGLSSSANSEEIARKYENSKNEYAALMKNCPKGLKKICQLQLEKLEKAFKLIFPQVKEEEDKKLKKLTSFSN